jgi:hypothetical protein
MQMPLKIRKMRNPTGKRRGAASLKEWKKNRGLVSPLSNPSDVLRTVCGLYQDFP